MVLLWVRPVLSLVESSLGSDVAPVIPHVSPVATPVVPVGQAVDAVAPAVATVAPSVAPIALILLQVASSSPITPVNFSL